MAVPPAYADLGKSAKDIFNKGYGNWKRDRRQFFKCVILPLGGIDWLLSQEVASHCLCPHRLWTG